MASPSDTAGEINPSILLIIVILSAIFFISGLLHLLVKLLLKPTTDTSPSDTDTVSALQGQLQQLFNLHDAGVDQSYIDTLPVFSYKSLLGGKEPLDCAVCLSEFDTEDKLRLLPSCRHAFHLPCIDTWLLSHSTCPLCRAPLPADVAEEEEVVPVKLGRFREGEGRREMEMDGRRCFSMGACEYVMDERLRLAVEIPRQRAALTGRSQRAESFSVSRIWRRTFSFRLPVSVAEENKGGDGNGIEVVVDVEAGRDVTRASETPSFARRSLSWLRGSSRIADHS